MIVLSCVNKVRQNKLLLDDVTCFFERGQIYGITGEKGCGKTTLIQMILGLAVASSGSVLVDGKELHRDIIYPGSIGYTLDRMGMLRGMSGYENLQFLSKINKRAGEREIAMALCRVGLPIDSVPVGDYTPAMNQKLNIAQAIFERPDIILLDEPMVSLNPRDQRRIGRILEEERDRGAVVLITSSDWQQIRSWCDVGYGIDQGKLVRLEEIVLQ